ncbi:MAG: hypothetical protein KKC01_08260 [Gammaproteobacteria bacterium]|nr:hypothetical protein [Gammaproteobacteria bacterium]
MRKRVLTIPSSMLRRLALVAMLIKLVVPAGFMPGNLLAGEWLTVCPQGLPAGLLAQSPHHHGAGSDVADSATGHADHENGQKDGHKGGQEDAQADAQDHQPLCPLGSGFAMAAASGQSPDCCRSATTLPPSPVRLPDYAAHTYSYHARAPPV